MATENNLLRFGSMGYQIDEKSFNALIKHLRGIGKVLGSPNLQLYRAAKLRDHIVTTTKSGSLYLKDISEATMQIQSGNHAPMVNTGELLKEMGVRAVGKNAAEVGYFKGGKQIPGKKITYTIAAVLHHAGYRIPLTGEKGDRVRKFLAIHGIFPKASTHWLVVPPRPFMFVGFYDYLSSGKDIEAVDEYLKTMTESPTDVSMRRE